MVSAKPRILDYMKHGTFVERGEWTDEYIEEEVGDWDSAELTIEASSGFKDLVPGLNDEKESYELEEDILEETERYLEDIVDEMNDTELEEDDRPDFEYEHWRGLEEDTFLLTGKDYNDGPTKYKAVLEEN